MDPRPLILVLHPDSTLRHRARLLLKGPAGFRVRSEAPPEDAGGLDLDGVSAVLVAERGPGAEPRALQLAIRQQRPDVALMLLTEPVSSTPPLSARFDCDELIDRERIDEGLVAAIGRGLRNAHRRRRSGDDSARQDWLAKLTKASEELEQRARALQGDLAQYRSPNATPRAAAPLKERTAAWPMSRANLEGLEHLERSVAESARLTNHFSNSSPIGRKDAN